VVGSPARERLHVRFEDVAVGQRSHMVNSAMGAAVPGTPTHKRQSVGIDGTNAVNLRGLSGDGRRQGTAGGTAAHPPKCPSPGYCDWQTRSS
jgi:hypothetical protein